MKRVIVIYGVLEPGSVRNLAGTPLAQPRAEKMVAQPSYDGRCFCRMVGHSTIVRRSFDGRTTVESNETAAHNASFSRRFSIVLRSF